MSTRSHTGRPGLSAWLCALAVVAAVPTCGRSWMSDLREPTAAELAFEQPQGELLMARHDCSVCHPAPPGVSERLRPLAAPDLSDVGARVSPSWLRAWLLDPHGMAPGTRMPDPLGDLQGEDKADAVEQLVHFLVGRSEPYAPRASRPEDWDIERGEALFTSLGCLACHPDGVEGQLATKTDLHHLAAFLQAPFTTRPHGAMPDLRLESDEALALAAWLLRDQHARGPTATTLTPGLELHAYLLDDSPAELPDFDALEPVSVRSVATVDVSARPRDDGFGLVFRGEVLVPRDGVTRFWIRSDDGSRLIVDGETVIDHDGLHSPTRAEGERELERGWHDLRIEMFENSGGEELSAGFVVDDEDEPFPADALRHTSTVYAPLGHEPVDPGWWSSWVGSMRYGARCGSCHPLDGAGPDPDETPLLRLRPDGRGCLDPEPDSDAPRFAFTPAERAALGETLAMAHGLRVEPTSQRAVDHGLALSNCLACHARDGEGGPVGAVRASFEGDFDLGDEGRLPPDLTGVGSRLRREWLARVLREGASVRPYLHARMPIFGERAVAPLIEHLPRVDMPFIAPPEPEGDAVSLAAGRALLGEGGLDCITCHTVAGHQGTGLPALDLATTAARLQWPAFRAWMLDPIALRPGTRMPTYFDAGRSIQTAVLDGDAEAQIAALWVCLALGDDLPLPPGLVVDRAGYDQVPIDGPVLLSVFMEGLSARTLAVGWPERVGAAFDLEHVRLGRLWGGDFLNMQGTWMGRAGRLEVPAGERVRDLPPGPALARADVATWPEVAGPEGGWQMVGRRREHDGSPTFLYAHQDGLQVEERITPRLDPRGSRCVRTLTLSGPGADAHALRAAVGASLTGAADGRVTTDDGLTLRVLRGTPALTPAADPSELRVRPDDDGVIEVEMSW